MTFLPLVLPGLVAVVLLWGLGGFLSWTVGLRGFWAAAAAPAFATTLIAGTAVVASWLGVGWSVIPVAVMTLLVGGVILLLRRRLPGAARAPRHRLSLWVPVVLLVTAGVIAFRIFEIIHGPANISQTFDNIFHLNAVRYVLTEADASALHLGNMTSPDGTLPFYPAAWHAVVALVVQLSGATIPVAVNAVVLTIAAIVWPMAAVLLTRTLFGRALPITVGAALLAASIPAFPTLLMDYGVLYPLQLSLALLPIALAATLRMLGISTRPGPREPGWWALILVGVIPGLTIAHPGGFVAWLALTVPMMVLFLVRLFRSTRSVRWRFLVIGAAVVYAVAGVLLVRVLRPPLEARGWAPELTMPHAFGQVLSVSMFYAVPAVVAAICVAVGIVWALVDRTPRSLIALAIYLVAALLFITVAALPWPTLRDALTGSWYNNLPRLAAILAVTMVPLGAYGVARTWFLLTGRLSSGRGLGRGARTIIGAGAAGILLVGLQSDGAMARAVDWASPIYRLTDSPPLLSEDEYALLLRVPDEVPPGVGIAGSAWTGASLASAISDRPVLMPHTLMQFSPELALINDGLDSAQRGDAVCAALDELGVGYVLDFGRKEVHPGEHDFPGLDDLASSSAVTLVDREGDAKLYEITACG